jgi:hypothetical protein
MKTFKLISAFLLVLVLIFNSTEWSVGNSGGAVPARTGAPTAAGGTELTCQACHGGSLNTGRASAGSSGIDTAGIIFGGSPTGTATELYNGTSFSNSGNLSTPRYQIGGARSAPNSAALGFVGYSYPGSFKNNTEEFTGAALATRTITTS